MAIVYRNVKGSNLTADEIDGNFHDLDDRVEALEDISIVANNIDYFVVTGDLLYVHMQDHSIKGPYSLPSASTWNPQGAWLPLTNFAQNDVVTNAGSTYLVLLPLLTASVFDPNATDGLGHNYYKLIIPNPTPTRNIGLFIEGKPLASELLLRYEFALAMKLPANLVGSRASSNVHTVGAISYSLFKNGAAIGTINFIASPNEATFTFSTNVTFAIGDILTLVGPAVPDANQADISITLQGTLV